METALTQFLQRLRSDRGWSVRQMAMRMDIPSSTFDQIIKGDVVKPDSTSLQKIAQHTGASMDYLLSMT